jgi:hypothetical protein
VNFCLNKGDLCSKSLHFSKSTLDELENGVAIVELGEIFWGIAAIPNKQLEANLV